MMIKRLLCYGLLSALGLVNASMPTETLKLDLAKAAKVVIENKEILIEGSFKTSSGKSGLIVGKENGISLPAEKLFGSNGTIFIRFKVDEPQVDFKTPRYMLTLRGEGRTWIGFCRYGDNRLFLNFRYVGENYHMRTPENLKFGQWYTAACTWDGIKVVFYLDGVYVAEQKQHIPAKFPLNSKLNIGPFKDSHVTAKPWQENDIMFNEIITFDQALSPLEIASLAGVEIKPTKKIESSIVIPMVNTAPKIDGTLNDSIWQQSSSFISLIDGQSPTQSLAYPQNNVFYCYDKENIYIGFRALFPRLAQIPKGNERTDKDIEVWADESFELYINYNGVYRFAGNVAGGYTESLNKDNAFNKDWTFKSTLKHQIDDSQLWEGEIAIPFSTINMETPQNGQELKFNFCRTWRSLDRIGTTSLGTENYPNIETFASLIFGGKSGALQSLDSSNPNLGTFTQTLLISSPVEDSYNYTVTLLDSKGITPPAKLMTKDIKLSANSSETFSLSEKINQSNYNTILYQFKRQNDSKFLMQQAIPFKITEDYLAIKPAFSVEKIIIQPRIELLKGKVGSDAKFILVLEDASGNIISEKDASSSAITEVNFMRSNPAGKYVLSLFSIEGKQKKIQTQKTFFYPGVQEWEKLQYSLSKVLPPFTPMISHRSEKELSVTLWGRVYKWQNTLFPSAISSNNITILSSPVSMTIDGNPVETSKTTFSHTSPARIELKSIAQNKNYEVTNNAWVEYDGLLWNSVKITAHNDLKNLQLKLKMPENIAKFLHAAAGGFGADGGFSASIKQEQSLEFYPVIWLGNEERGLCWFAESTAGWQTSSKKPIRIFKNNNETILEISMADKLSAGKSMEFSFGLIATPIKPLPANYPLNTFNANYAVEHNMAPPNAPTTATMLHTNRLGEGFDDIDPEDLDKLKSSVKLAHSNYAKCIPYMDPLHFPEEYPTASAYRDEWQMLPERHLSYKYKDHEYKLLWCCPASNATNFFLWKTKQLIKDSDIDGIYFDFGQVRLCNNEMHGCKNRYPILAMRNFYRGIANAFVEAGKEDYQIILHASQAVQVPAFTFITAMFNGEHFRQQSTETFHNGKDILDTLTLADFATEFSSLPWGITSSIYMPTDPLQEKYGGHKDSELYVFRMTKAFLAGSLIHDTIPAINRGHYGLFDKLVRIYDRFQVPKAKFMPYWSNEKAVKVIKGSDIYASAYKHHSKPEVLLIVSHVAKAHNDQAILLELNPQEFGLSKITSAEEVLSADQPEYSRLFKETNRRRIPVKLGDYGTKLNGLDQNQLDLFLKYHSVAIIHIKGE